MDQRSKAGEQDVHLVVAPRDDDAPEKKLTLFAMRLAILEKTATGLGTLGFIWATVVLLGGFAITLEKTDFWFITFILLIEGGRIFSRSHELEWQQQVTWSLNDESNSMNVLRLVETQLQTRRWDAPEVPLLPYAPWVSLTKNISKSLQWLQILAAIACVVLSLMKLKMRNFGKLHKCDSDERNRKSALLIFYGLALAEASLFLLEKIYWHVKVFHHRVLDKVTNDCGLEPSSIVAVKRFFYDAYSRCLKGSIFDGLKMDMVSFSMDLLASASLGEQLMGIQILRSFATSDHFSTDTLQKIGETYSSVERLVEMLNWKHIQDQGIFIRISAAEILSKLAGKKQNCLRVAAIPGAIESISSLLNSSHEAWNLSHMGLKILKKLARNHDNCEKIGNTRGLLSKIIDFTNAGEEVLKGDNDTIQVMTVKESFEVIKTLASTTGSIGKQLRRDISEIVYTVVNIRDILRNGEKHTYLQKLGIEILTSLAMEDDAKEMIAETGGVLKELLNIFFRDDQNTVGTMAGEALVMIALESKQNCYHILKLGALEKLVKALQTDFLRINAARILRNLCIYSPGDCYLELIGITEAVPTVLMGIVSEEEELQEVMVGLAPHAFQFTTYNESILMFEQAGVTEDKLANELVKILNKYPYPNIEFPGIRRFTIELVIWMMRHEQTNIHIFKNLQLHKELQNVLDTTSELESFNILSGPFGLTRFQTTMHSLVEKALSLLQYQLSPFHSI